MARHTKTALDSGDTYKTQALPQMKATIDLFSDMADDGQRVVDKIETNNHLIE